MVPIVVPIRFLTRPTTNVPVALDETDMSTHPAVQSVDGTLLNGVTSTESPGF